MDVKELIQHELQLKQVDLISINMKKNLDHKTFNTTVSIPLSVELNHEVLNERSGYSIIEVKVGNEETPFKIEIMQRGLFETENAINANVFSKFLEVQGLKILWSYVRQSIFDITAKSGLAPYMLPTLDVLATLEKTNIEE